MSWGLDYTYKGRILRMTKDQLFYKKEELEQVNEMLWQEILSYMASTPTPTAKDDDASEGIIWQEYITLKFRELKRSLEENLQELHQINDCIDAMDKDYNNVKENNHE